MKKTQFKGTKILSKKEPEKGLLLRIKKTGGRSRNGRLTVRHIGGGAKKMYRMVDFAQNKRDMKATVLALEYDPNRTPFIALVQYEDGEKRYILAPKNLKEGDQIITSEKTEVKGGNRMQLKNIPEGEDVYNIEIDLNSGGKLVRSAGASATVLAHDEGYTLLKMPSSERRKIRDECFATIGVVSNSEHRFVKLKKAGTARRLGRRPTVRGSAMNPVDHPHGGGEGRSGVGMKYPKTPWGKHALGVKTRRKKWSDKLIVTRRKNKKRK